MLIVIYNQKNRRATGFPPESCGNDGDFEAFNAFNNGCEAVRISNEVARIAR